MICLRSKFSCSSFLKGKFKKQSKWESAGKQEERWRVEERPEGEGEPQKTRGRERERESYCGTQEQRTDHRQVLFFIWIEAKIIYKIMSSLRHSREVRVGREGSNSAGSSMCLCFFPHDLRKDALVLVWSLAPPTGAVNHVGKTSNCDFFLTDAVIIIRARDDSPAFLQLFFRPGCSVESMLADKCHSKST